MSLVELCGLPGAGKSTLCREVMAELRIRGVAPRDRSLTPGARHRWYRLARKGWSVFLAFLGGPTHSLAVARAVRASDPGFWRWVARTGNLLLWHRESRRHDGLCLTDQGLVQELVSVAVTGSLDATLSALPVLAWPSTLVVLDVPDEVAAARLARRGTGESRLEALSGDQLLAELGRARVALATAVGAAEGAGAKVLRVDGSSGDAAETVVSHLLA